MNRIRVRVRVRRVRRLEPLSVVCGALLGGGNPVEVALEGTTFQLRSISGQRWDDFRATLGRFEVNFRSCRRVSRHITDDLRSS